MITLTLSPAQIAERGRPYIPLEAPGGSSYTHLGHAQHYGVDRRGKRARLIVWHTTESLTSTLLGALSYDARRADQVSATAYIHTDGIGLDTPETGRPYTQSRWNDEALSAEIVARSAWTYADWLARPTLLEHLAVWTADVARRHGIPLRWLTPTEVLAGEPGVCDHLTCNQAAILEDPTRRGRSGYTHTDCGPGLRSLSELVLDRSAELNTPAPVRPVPTVEEIPMRLIQPWDDLTPDAATFLEIAGVFAVWLATGDDVAAAKARGATTEPSAGNPWPVARQDLVSLVLIGPAPAYGPGTPGGRTTADDFRS